MSLPPAFLDELRARVPVSQVVGRRVKLQRAGRELKGCCPFHNEKTPSFYVNDDKGFYHCFGCGAHGDVIRFVVEQDGLPFIEAVKSLAAEAGLQLPERTPGDAEREERRRGQHAILDRAAKWFQSQLDGLGGAEARAYLERRGVPAGLARDFGLGFAPDARTKLKTALAEDGVDALVEAGLLARSEDGRESYDRFRGRLIFPIRDPRGRTVGFGGRTLGEGQPKYLNSPDTPLFDKGRLLYNLDRAAAAGRKAGRLIVVEGYMDVIALAKAGIDEAVAPLGTAMTEAQLELAWRVTGEPVLCFDGDAAGRRAARKAAERALPLLGRGRSLQIMFLPDGQDPDDLVRAGGRDAFLALLPAAQPLSRFLAEQVAGEADDSTPERRAAVKAKLAELANSVGDPAVRAEYHADYRRFFWDRYGWSRDRQDVKPPPWRALTPLPRPVREEGFAILQGLLRFPDVAARHLEQLTDLPLDDADAALVRDAIIDALVWDPDMADERLLGSVAQTVGSERLGRLRTAPRLRFAFGDAAADEETARAQLHLAVDAVVGLGLNQQARREVRVGLRAAQEGGDAEETERLMQTLRALYAERKRLYESLGDFAHDRGATRGLRPLSTAGRMSGDLDGEEQSGGSDGNGVRQAG